MIPGFGRLSPGDRVSAAEWNRLCEEVERLAQIKASPPLELVPDAGGYLIRLDLAGGMSDITWPVTFDGDTVTFTDSTINYGGGTITNYLSGSRINNSGTTNYLSGSRQNNQSGSTTIYAGGSSTTYQPGSVRTLGGTSVYTTRPIFVNGMMGGPNDVNYFRTPTNNRWYGPDTARTPTASLPTALNGYLWLTPFPTPAGGTLSKIGCYVETGAADAEIIFAIYVRGGIGTGIAETAPGVLVWTSEEPLDASASGLVEDEPGYVAAPGELYWLAVATDSADVVIRGIYAGDLFQIQGCDDTFLPAACVGAVKKGFTFPDAPATITTVDLLAPSVAIPWVQVRYGTLSTLLAGGAFGAAAGGDDSRGGMEGELGCSSVGLVAAGGVHFGGVAGALTGTLAASASGSLFAFHGGAAGALTGTLAASSAGVVASEYGGASGALTGELGCSASGTVSGGATPISTACCVSDIPSILYATIPSDIGSSCSCAFGLETALVYDAISSSWKGTLTLTDCAGSGGTTLNLELTCTAGVGGMDNPSAFSLHLTGCVDVMTPSTFSGSCSPLNLHYEFSAGLDACCGVATYIPINITESP